MANRLDPDVVGRAVTSSTWSLSLASPKEPTRRSWARRSLTWTEATIGDAIRLYSFILAQTVGFSVSYRGRNVYLHAPPTTVVDLSATEHCHCLAARKRAREITRLYEEKLRLHDLRATQFSVLAALALKGPTPLGELADVLGLERTSLTRTANRMEDDGWLTGPSRRTPGSAS